ncbi:hypothetical protein [Duganella sp. Root1480D1]|uniref:hypothetical protein n=1 Tax=Duganella sp. Root1480D1 TaxID=1736471 RepID=UPI00071087FB|nr:hypothetical protein [Duganella sp. Root1480D1]KQZ42240.1 hypothetical protein ASD58_25585 [Duganella sp. Root1480D1]
MRRVLLLTCLFACLPGFAKPDVSLGRFDDPAVQQAVREAAAQAPAPSAQPTADFTGGEQARRLDLAFKEAEVPDCLHSEGLKRQPPVILFIPLSGVLALPFVGIAKLRGKCK